MKRLYDVRVRGPRGGLLLECTVPAIHAYAARAAAVNRVVAMGRMRTFVSTEVHELAALAPPVH